MSTRLPASKRNAIIADFNAGVNDPDYEVIPSKTVKGKFTVRKRTKTEEAPEQPAQEEAPTQEEEPQQEEEETQEVDDQTNAMFNPYAYFQEYQLQVNRLMIEQMKALRQNNKYMLKKQQKYKQRQKQIRDIFTEVANEEPKQVQQPPPQEKETEEEEQQQEEPQEEVPPITSYFQSNYPQQETAQPPQRVETPAPEPIQYKNDYEATLDNMAGTFVYGSRRDRLKAFI